MAAAPQQPWWDDQTVAVVTGSNKGIGYAISKQLAEAGLRVVMAARSEELGRAALAKLQQELPAASSARLLFRQLDISDAASVAAFKRWLLEGELAGRLDILVNNAGIAYKGSAFGPDEAAATLAVNYWGTAAVCEALAPLLPRGGRIVNVSSTAGRLSIFPGPTLKQQLEHPDSRQQLDGLATKFVEDIRAGRYVAEGWPNSMYGVSKALETAYSRVLAAQLKEAGVMVNACHPGYVATDMSSHRGHLTIEEGADTPVWLALIPPQHFVTGGFFSDRERTSF